MNETPFIPITKYVTVSAELLQDIDEKVNKAIEDGWQPFGGITFGKTSVGVIYYIQVLVKYGEIGMIKIDKENVQG